MECSKKNCKRHEFDHGVCLEHLRNPDAPVRKKRKKKIDATEVTTTDSTESHQTR